MQSLKFWDQKKRVSNSASRAYAGAVFNRLVTDWMASSASADAEIRGPLKVLRNRSRELGRNNDYMRQFLRETVNNVVGPDGIKLQAQVKKQRGGDLNQTLNDKIEEEWCNWCKADNCDVAGKLFFQDIEGLAIREAAEAGEFFIRKIRKKFGKSKVPLALEVIEADRVDDDMNGIAENGNAIVMGVEKDSWGRPTAFYIKPVHPGDNSPVRNNQNSRMNIRIPADEIIHLGKIERWPQTRSIPWIASSMMRLHQMQGYEEAEVIAARASAALMGFIESPDGEIHGESVQNGQQVTTFEPGVFKKLAPGEKVNVPDLHRPSGQLGPFMQFMLRGVAAGLGTAYETISKDFSNTSYSSARTAILPERDNWRVVQKWMVRNFHQKIFEEWLDMAVLSGVLDLPGYELNPEKYQKVKWMPRGWAWVDPEAEVAANKEAIKGGQRTLTQTLAEDGIDIVEHFDQRQREMKLAKERELLFDTDLSINKYGQGNTNSSPKNNSQDANDVDPN
jgi:lambda family phage portal protein